MSTAQASTLIERLQDGTITATQLPVDDPMEDDRPKGPGDPDHYGYPGEEELTDESIAENLDKAAKDLIG